MAFNPVVPVPKITEPKSKVRSQFVDEDFYNNCKQISKMYQQDIFTKVIL